MRIVAVPVLLFLSSCGLPSQYQGPVNTDAAIIGGTFVPDGAPLASGIVGVYDTEFDGICTGSLIAENLVLTAAHCISPRSKLKITFGSGIDGAVHSRPVVGQEIHPKWRGSKNGVDPENPGWGDIAILKFSGKAPEGYRPVNLLADGRFLRPGLSVIVAGYGVSKVTLTPIEDANPRILADAIESGDVVCDDDNKCSAVEMSGDGELRQTKVSILELGMSEFRLDESKGRGTCSGDSGGPVFLERSGRLYLFGITSRGSELCDEVGVYTYTVYYNSWIRDTIVKMK